MDHGPGVVDLLALAVAGIGYALGRSKGFAWQLSGLLTLLGGGFCATILSRPLAPACGGGLLGRFVAWIVVYALVAICLYVLTLRFRHRLKELELDELDRRFGGLLGGIKSLSMFALVLLVAVPLSPPVAKAVKGSFYGRALRGLVHELRALLPERIHEGFGPWLDAVDPALGPTQAQVTEPPPARPDPPAPPPAPPAPVPTPTPQSPVQQPPVQQPPVQQPPVPQPPVPQRPVPQRPVPQPTAQPTAPTPVVRPLPDLPPSPPEEPDPEPIPDPFDTSHDPPDPLAPPR